MSSIYEPSEPSEDPIARERLLQRAQAHRLEDTDFSWIEESFGPSPGLVKHYRLRRKLLPFLPYIEKRANIILGHVYEPGSVEPDESWINTEIICSWLRVCDQNHGDKCKGNQIAEARHPPRWVIDVKDRCLIRGTTSIDYFALSYVWGNAVSTETLKSNIATFRKLRGLARPSVKLPKVVHDAMRLVESLGHRYLWVDRLCIVQNSGSQKEEDLNHMAEIYAGAYATIIAAQGKDANHGLSGLPGSQSPRKYSQSYMPLDNLAVETSTCFEEDPPDSNSALNSIDEPETHNSTQTTTNIDKIDPAIFNKILSLSEFIPEPSQSPDASDIGSVEINVSHSTQSNTAKSIDNVNDRPDMDPILEQQSRFLMASKWFTRGWTFQEHMFSRRRIVFQNNTVNWECHHTAWHESQGVIPLNPQRLAWMPEQQLDFDENSWPDLHRYSRLIALYNRRQLTYEEDVLDAFAGAISTLAKPYQGDFISGLPEMFFDCALLWQPHRQLKRRVASKNAPAACLPSWSWIGWQGNLNSESWRSGYNYMRKNPDEFYEQNESVWQKTSWQTYSVVKWYQVLGVRNRRAVKVTGHAYQDSETRLGWTRHDLGNGTPESVYFTRYGTGQQEFWFPIPLPRLSDQPSRSLRCNLITCRTKRLVLSAGEKFSNPAASECLSVDLLDDNKTWVGVLRLNVNKDGIDLEDAPTHELIELSRGRVKDQVTEEVSFDEWFRPGCPRTKGVYEFINVMSIRRKNGIAFRKAVGRVTQEAWTRLPTEVVNIILG